MELENKILDFLTRKGVLIQLRLKKNDFHQSLIKQSFLSRATFTKWAYACKTPDTFSHLYFTLYVWEDLAKIPMN